MIWLPWKPTVSFHGAVHYSVYIYCYSFTFIFTAPTARQWSFSNLWAPERQPYPRKGMWTMETFACQWKHFPLTIVLCHSAPRWCHIWAHEFLSSDRNHTDASRWPWFVPVMALALIRCQGSASDLGSEIAAATKLGIVCTELGTESGCMVLKRQISAQGSSHLLIVPALKLTPFN